ncbi:hypothetical protein G5714_019278 [Onychostoma macrolepis]|uniref:Alpha-2-macroglobulin n=1 Tax=Onychostoma macrolepis TaxID=369639 RepID=A0A7J6BZW5_9TELE|nr:hypothetical protein G5714_019278 [Onychostoma macrolepis]
MTVSLLDQKNQTTQLVQQRSSAEFHRCFSFQAPRVDGELVQKLRVVVQGRVFKMIEERKVLFIHYLPLTFIQTDKPICNPGQTVNFRLVTMNAKFVPLDQMVILPKFDVTLTAPQMYNVGDVGLKIEACSKYTYDQPVPGQALVEVCREPVQIFVEVPGLTRQCLYKSIKMNAMGCASLTFSTSVFFNSKFENYMQNYFFVNVTVTEEGTVCPFMFEVGKITFVELPEFFEPGSTILGKVSASFFNGTPIVSKVVYLLNGSSWPNELLLNLTTNQNGLASFSFNTELHKADLNLVASATPVDSYGYKSPYFSSDTRVVQHLQPATPNSLTFIELSIVTLEQPLKCGTTYPVTIKYSFLGETGSYDADIVYMVLSRGVIVLHGFKKVQVRASNTITSGTMSFQLFVSGDLAPVVQILAFCVLPSVNVVVGSAAFDTEMCFQNQLFSLQLLPFLVRKTLTVSAQAGSLCGLSTVDQSILIMELGRRLSAEMVFNMLPIRSASGYPYGVDDEQECLSFRLRRAVPIDHAYTSLRSVGMKLATNLNVREPECLTYKGMTYYRSFHKTHFDEKPFAVAAMAPAPVAESGGESRSSYSFDATVRTYFPETWIWQLAQVGQAFCLSSKGFGLAPPVSLMVFQPFFLELSLPYSIIRGEYFELKATVFNYLSKCIMVKVTPAQSLDFTLRPLNDSYSSCLCSNGRRSFKWLLSASADGVERTVTQSWLLCPKASVISEDVTLMFPVNVIQGSAKCSISVLGDIMGRALKNLGGLLQMPYGCGKKNMGVLASNIYILQYLKVTAQLTTAIQETAMGYLQRGYQGQLNYRHHDGSYSTFGYDESNTWLTASVLRSFGLARRFIFIDPNVLQSAKDWLISKQGSDGCFMQQGTLYHYEMKGGVDENDPVITSALSCLRSVVENLKNTYATALLAYTFSLAGEASTRSQLLTILDNRAISEGTKLHWSQTSLGDTLVVEISSYVLLAFLSVQPLTTDALSNANHIVNWLVVKQNPYGGFFSTQDTVVALHALSVYAAEVFSLEGSSTVTVQSSVVGGDSYSVAVNRDNRLLYQEKPLKNVPGKYSVKVTGSTCVSVQLVCFYNIPTPVIFARMLTLEAKVKGDCQLLGANLMLSFTVKYSGAKASTNMVIVNIKLLSGFTADTSPLGTPPDAFVPLVERVDAGEDHVLVYLKEVPKGVPMSYTIRLKRVLVVKNLKPAVINVYDYYQTSDQFETTYTSPCQ